MKIIGVLEDEKNFNTIDSKIMEIMDDNNITSLLFDLPKNWPEIYRKFEPSVFSMLVARYRRRMDYYRDGGKIIKREENDPEKISITYGGCGMSKEWLSKLEPSNGHKLSYDEIVKECSPESLRRISLESAIRENSPELVVVDQQNGLHLKKQNINSYLILFDYQPDVYISNIILDFLGRRLGNQQDKVYLSDDEVVDVDETVLLPKGKKYCDHGLCDEIINENIRFCSDHEWMCNKK